jgi:hypothetical protein
MPEYEMKKRLRITNQGVQTLARNRYYNFMRESESFKDSSAHTFLR